MAVGQEGKRECEGTEINTGSKRIRKHGNKESCPDLPKDMWWQPIDQSSASDKVGFLTPTAIDRADFLVYVKQEGHKADDTKAPTHIWSFFFKESFLSYFGIENGVEVDWQKRTFKHLPYTQLETPKWSPQGLGGGNE